MSDTLWVGSPAILVHLRRSARARRLSLRVSGLDGRVSLTLPAHVPLAEGRAFAQERAEWIRAQLAQVAPWAPRIGGSLPFLGRDLTLCAADLRRPQRDGTRLMVPPDPARLGARLRAWLREEARARLVPLSAGYAAQLGRPMGRVTLRDTRSRWGSCTARGDLMYSWRLVMAPLPVLAYVAAHEVAHLAEMNHSPRFWAQVARLCPGWRAQRDWLRQNGAQLHQIRFDD